MHREKLNDERWLRNYHELQKYLALHPEYNISTIPTDYRTEHNVLLARWVYEQHKAYYGNRENNTLPDKQMELMKIIGIEEYRSIADKLWFERFEELKKFYNINHTLIVPTDYRCADGSLLVSWTRIQRKKYHDGTLKKKYMNALENAGFMEILETNEERGLRHAKEYYKKYHHLNIPCVYVCDDGYRLGIWIRSIRESKQKLKEQTRNQLNKMGMIWSVPENRWMVGFLECYQYFKKNGNLNVPKEYRSESGIELYNWLRNNRAAYRKGKLSQDKIAKLKEIGALIVADK